MIKKSKLGFTLIELIAIITLLGIIAAIITPVVNNVVKENNLKIYNIQIENIISGAKKWASENVFLMPENEETITLTLGNLKKEGYIDDQLINPQTKKEFSNNLIIKIIKVNNKYKYEITDDLNTDSQNNKNAPTIVLIGENIQYVEINELYEDQGVKITDKNGDVINDYTKLVLKKVGDKYENVSMVDTSTISEYRITYIATDNKLITKAYRTVMVRNTKK
ncbi:MAG: prepilin-type N-terminal cleavage/methylation domain-containing protein [Bacilli bacterium]